MIKQTSRSEDLQSFISLMEEGLQVQMAEDGTQDAKMVAKIAEYRAELADLAAKGIDAPGMGTGTVEGKAHSLTARPKAGAAARNQYGTFTVRYASEKQTRFIAYLLESKDLTSINSSPIRATLDVDALRQQVAALEVNKKAASDIIDRLLSCPDKMVVAPAARPAGQKATDKQVALIRRLAGEKDLSDEDRAKVLAAVDTLSKKGASATIDKMFALPKAIAPAPAEVEAGVYTDGVQTFRVYLGQKSGKMLAALAIRHEDGSAEFEYQGQADRFVTSAFRRLTIEEAAEFGKATGTCIVCARRLDVPESVDRGIGPVCFAKMSG